MSKAPEMPNKPAVDERDRQISVDSEACFEDDEFGDYDFAPNTGKRRGGGGGHGTGEKKSGGRGVYTAKHVRAKEAMRQNQKSSPKK
ncbi:hypothetical protein IV203_031142 [Nitzschia inconspicua]|uniref:Uncharacterized protein n=1 Tax=Nitzschia inconspicua TaxID=303405 RepID=A0A9K3Q4U7_9STRA|nr:hypothetical protein IV203_031142 [Nitzschia inconspicua]